MLCNALLKMAVPEPEDSSTDSFVENSQITYLVPSATNINLEQLFKDADDSQAVFDSVDRRESLFFGRFRFLYLPKNPSCLHARR